MADLPESGYLRPEKHTFSCLYDFLFLFVLFIVVPNDSAHRDTCSAKFIGASCTRNGAKYGFGCVGHFGLTWSRPVKTKVFYVHEIFQQVNINMFLI